jgi:hypothetical protein
VPSHLDHPDHEQLAAFQAGDGDRRQRADVQAHLTGCPSCAEVVASVEQARRRLTLLEEPALPPGLHDRLAAAVQDEAARTAPARPAPWYRRPVAWGAAAAVLLAALAIPLLDRSGGNLTTAGGGGADSAKEAASPGTGGLPVLRLPGEVTVAKVRAELATDSRAKAALDAASAAAAPGAQAATPRNGQGAGPSTQSPAGGDRHGPATMAPQAGRPSTPAPRAGAANLEPCLPAATAAANRAITPLRPAFFIQGSYEGREATILVTTSAGQPGRVDLWVFPRDDCSAPPLASENVR